VSESNTEAAADTFQEGTTPVQAFTSPVVAVPADDAGRARRGRPSRRLQEQGPGPKEVAHLPQDGASPANEIVGGTGTKPDESSAKAGVGQ